MKQSRGRRDGVVALSCAAIAAAMVGASFAAVPLYDMFCRATGYGDLTAGLARAAAGVPVAEHAETD